MELENPYQPPRGDGQEEIATHKKAERPVYDTRWQATWAGMRRGAVPGMLVVTVVFAVLIGGLLASYFLGWLPRSTFPESWLFFCLQAVIIIFGGGFFYGAIPGGWIMAFIEMMRFGKTNRPPQKKEERPVCHTRRQATWAGMRRGLVLGMVIATVLWAVFLILAPATIMFLLLTDTESVLSSNKFLTVAILMPAHVGILFAGWFLTAIESGIIAGIIMGLIEMIRFRKAE